jgi:hypothetical protein
VNLWRAVSFLMEKRTCVVDISMCARQHSRILNTLLSFTVMVTIMFCEEIFLEDASLVL